MAVNTNENATTQGISTSNTSTQTPNIAPKAVDTSTMSNSNEFFGYEVLKTNILEIAELKNRITDLENQQNKTKSFYKSVTKLSNISTIVIYILIIIPLLQLIGCVAVVHHLGIQDNLPGLLSWALSCVSVFSLAEIILIPIKFYSIYNKINSLEEKNNDKKI